ncbi:hypothetical protein PVT68_07590 [Microbulbifer bruguierae]|uniref:DUF2384 domain-containing protein n=1 Tax=Microbulbifer bruguierae TaxID=3029061 RepID=A0ABY8NGT5_9GAMM|nr:hypothetical protein [Microbulbifer bruguierae]WGL18150.1 hypothetical protein PVT68_07590 [Microbulbifer bruguierae]
MSVGAWEPTDQASNDQSRRAIEPALLHQIVAAMEPDTQDLNTLAPEIQNASWLAGLPATQWLEQAVQLDDARIWALIRFFTLAEMQLQDWQGGAESPVIPLAKCLRQRKSPLSREQLLWIRAHSDNRYLPYGPL